MKYKLLTLVLLLMFCGCKSSQKIIKQTNQDKDLINYLFQDYIGEKPSASFIVIKNGKIKHCQSFGYANLENQTLANCETNYRIASVTKQFTAMGILILINQGKLNYDSKLTEIIPEFPDYGKEITIKNLMLHRSGLQSYNRLYPKDWKKQLVDKDVLNLLIKQDSLLFPTNSKFKYSNSGYAVLATIIERVSGKSFKEFMDEEVFEKLGMTNTTVYLKDLKIKNRAYGYKFIKNKYENKDQTKYTAIQGDGGIYSSVSDYAKWDKILYNETLVSKELLNDAFSNWNENGKTNGKGYGFGWQIDEKNGKKYLLHGGSTSGFLNTVLRIPSEKITVAIFTNNGSKGGLKRKALYLASYFSDGKIPFPAYFLIKKDIEENGINNITAKFNQLKNDSTKYDIEKEDLRALGFSYFKKEPEKSLKIFELIKMEFPDFYGGYFGLAQYYAYKTEGNNEKAVEYYKKAIELTPHKKQRLINYSKKMIKKLSK
ncbi:MULTISPECIES: serine hydrolase domain-containing protein [unclassified Tenacibaculum]|uniref:serine hydrolase domain-containing protein n=1 Tax=unclassified Tenacibaculum TaxID=2635139 RepID=UPI001F3DB29C|nr:MULTISPECIES: serine hydrolase domain-containing protein [unclassified Tenacibaculum]MCF2874775.1 serine hydrolase [Tenacibaculum sp. Cn5-1]MCF2934159.1 serine hydrolase [Tenacibaculum sp. Cn5-34]MCG7510369.1 serine hydrolase [Tenacibaculum sp. Cn5-46]